MTARIVHARLDDDSRRILARLQRRLGLSESELVRRGLRALVALPSEGARRIAGLGKFASGKRDLGSNKAHLRGFGED